MKASEGVGIQASDGAFYMCYGRDPVLLKMDGAVYAPCARENGDSLEGNGGLELLGLELN